MQSKIKIANFIPSAPSTNELKNREESVSSNIQHTKNTPQRDCTTKWESKLYRTDIAEPDHNEIRDDTGSV